jgi:hypothetical protein
MKGEKRSILLILATYFLMLQCINMLLNLINPYFYYLVTKKGVNALIKLFKFKLK